MEYRRDGYTECVCGVYVYLGIDEHLLYIYTPHVLYSIQYTCIQIHTVNM